MCIRDRVMREDLDVLVVDGGDGTVREIASRWFDLPRRPRALGIIEHGNTNLIARKVGRVSDLGRLAQITQDELTSQVASAPILRFDFDAASRPVRGFIAGGGAYALATETVSSSAQMGGTPKVITTVIKTLFRAGIGRGQSALRDGVATVFSGDGAEIRNGSSFLGIVTALDGALVARLNPFWGDGSGAIRWTNIDAPPAHMARGMLRAAFGCPAAWMTAAGYTSGRADRIELELDGPLIVDGDRVGDLGRQRITISADETLPVLAI